MAVVCELIHSASLLHDDICDSDEIRRGKVSVWKNFGIPAAICTGDYLIAESFRKITEIEQGWHQNILLNLLSGTVKEIVFGQSGDVNSNFLSLSWEEYIKLATAKTSPLICLPIMGMFKCAELEEPYYINLRKLTDEIGLAYQIVNDLENILFNQPNEIPTDIKFERVNALIVLLKEMSSEKEINFLKKNKSELKQYLLSSNIADDLIIKIENILQGIKNSLHLMPVVIRPIISSLNEEIEKKISSVRTCKLKKIIVIGSGFGGIAAALRMRAKGYEVDLHEKLDQIGGRARQFNQNGFIHDAGPTVITAPYLFRELFEIFDEEIDDFINFIPLDPWYRFRFHDGSFFNYGPNQDELLEQIKAFEPRDVNGYLKMLKHAEKIF